VTATAIGDPRSLFLHELRTMLWVEHELAETVLPELFELVRATGLRRDVGRHLRETEGHERNVRRVLVRLGERADPEPAPALLALRQEHESLLRLVDREELADLVHADAIARTEHYELAVYGGLVHLARALALPLELVALLRENMEQEAYALEQVEDALAQLLAERIEHVP
jgi:ferritin-like metal-binding protein YciE